MQTLHCHLESVCFTLQHAQASLWPLLFSMCGKDAIFRRHVFPTHLLYTEEELNLSELSGNVQSFGRCKAVYNQTDK